MKKYVIALAILAVASVCGRALTLKEAFATLSQVPNVSVVDQLASGSVGLSADSVGNLEIAVADNLDAARIKATGDAVYAVLDKVPLEYMINGAIIIWLPHSSMQRPMPKDVMTSWSCRWTEPEATSPFSS